MCNKLLYCNGLMIEAPVAQLDRASVYGTEGWGSESLQAYFFSHRGQLTSSCLNRRLSVLFPKGQKHFLYPVDRPVLQEALCANLMVPIT